MASATRHPMADPGESYRDMEDFIETIGSQRLRSQLAYAIQGRGAFRRFKVTLLAHPGELALAWLSAEGNKVVLDREQEGGG